MPIKSRRFATIGCNAITDGTSTWTMVPPTTKSTTTFVCQGDSKRGKDTSELLPTTSFLATVTPATYPTLNRHKTSLNPTFFGESAIAHPSQSCGVGSETRISSTTLPAQPRHLGFELKAKRRMTQTVFMGMRILRTQRQVTSRYLKALRRFRLGLRISRWKDSASPRNV